MSAARLGFVKIARSLIAKGVDVNSLAGWIYGRTALQEAVRCRRFDIVEFLLGVGADPKSQLGSKSSVLHDALGGPRDLELVSVLINNGADVNGPCDALKYQGSVLVCAATKCDRAMIRMLLDAGARVDEVLEGSLIALQASIGSTDIEVAQILIEAGADIDEPEGEAFAEARQVAIDNKEYAPLTTPIQRASMFDNTELVQILVHEGANVNACPWGRYTNDICEDRDNGPFDDTDLMTVLQGAVANGNAILIRVLLEADADIDARGFGDTPLQIAAANNETKIIQILLKHGADINAPASADSGKTALQAAASIGECELVQQFLDAGANVNALPSALRGRTALQMAVEEGNIELARILIEAGADLNAEASPKEGLTCIQAAAAGGHAELITILLNKGANVNSPAASLSGGLTALQAALGLFCLDELPITSRQGSRDTILQALLDAGADVNAPSSPQNGTTALGAVIKSRNLELARYLLLRGLDPNQHVCGETTGLG